MTHNFYQNHDNVCLWQADLSVVWLNERSEAAGEIALFALVQTMEWAVQPAVASFLFWNLWRLAKSWDGRKDEMSNPEIPLEEHTAQIGYGALTGASLY